MCDYSLMGVPNRMASEGEDLVVCKFRTGSHGLTPETSGTNTETRSEGFRSVVKRLFGPLEPEKVAVCIPPGARLLLGDISEDVQRSCCVGASEEVTFTQLTATPNRYRDAVRFKNGREILLQRLNQGQRVRVLQLSLVEDPVQLVWKGKEAELFRY
jgi:hypothetical protein